jgi:crossover junction endodeoxyribonuclease RusA
MLPLDPPALLALPDPISTNNLFVNVPGRGRIMSKDYREWKKTAAQMLHVQKPLPRFALPVSVTLYVGEKGVGQMDADNAAKACLDALVAAGVIHDDSKKWVRRVACVWVPDLRGTVAKLRVAEMDVSAAAIRSALKPRIAEMLR